jgi:hypothetical protein
VKLILQPSRSNLCGQTSMAMLLGISLADSIAAYRSRGKTSTRQHVKVLRERGYEAPDKLLRFTSYSALPELALLHANHPGGWKHWMLWAEGEVWDPLGHPSELLMDRKTMRVEEDGRAVELLIQRESLSMRVTSYLPIRRPAGPGSSQEPRPTRR